MSNYLCILIALIHPLNEFHISMSQLMSHASGIILFKKIPVSCRAWLHSAKLMT